uniref:Uncharacterized protein n=1 Tax=Tanacetum cinerariifolium TaxID=118510 RepID=A0A699IIL2_TANCI|nr:hypothetical protein [Tanacetum cinerariifolium]
MFNGCIGAIIRNKDDGAELDELRLMRDVGSNSVDDGSGTHCSTSIGQPRHLGNYQQCYSKATISNMLQPDRGGG